jgi:hypothetical protein
MVEERKRRKGMGYAGGMVSCLDFLARCTLLFAVERTRNGKFLRITASHTHHRCPPLKIYASDREEHFNYHWNLVVVLSSHDGRDISALGRSDTNTELAYPKGSRTSVTARQIGTSSITTQRAWILDRWCLGITVGGTLLTTMLWCHGRLDVFWRIHKTSGNLLKVESHQETPSLPSHTLLPPCLNSYGS